MHTFFYIYFSLYVYGSCLWWQQRQNKKKTHYINCSYVRYRRKLYEDDRSGFEWCLDTLRLNGFKLQEWRNTNGRMLFNFTSKRDVRAKILINTRVNKLDSREIHAICIINITASSYCSLCLKLERESEVKTGKMVLCSENLRKNASIAKVDKE